jgi:hypothetical protein
VARCSLPIRNQTKLCRELLECLPFRCRGDEQQHVARKDRSRLHVGDPGMQQIACRRGRGHAAGFRAPRFSIAPLRGRCVEAATIASIDQGSMLTGMRGEPWPVEPAA